MSQLSMTVEERQQFLAGVHVGVLALTDPERGPLAAPVWYDYEPGGELRFVTGRTSRKGRLVELGRRVSLVAQTEEAPFYKYVSVEGPVVAIEPSTFEEHRKPMAYRYLGPEMGDVYLQASVDEGEDSVVVRVRPERWLTVDYQKQFAALAAGVDA